jgi:hypothetical protein
MDLQPRLESLQRRHEALEQALHEETAHPYHDDVRIRTLKLEKLHLKEEIKRLEAAANSNRSRWH